MNLKGTTVAMVTPFTKEDEVDEAGMRENINYLITVLLNLNNRLNIISIIKGFL